MTKREGAIVSAYTGFLIGDFSEMHKYTEELMGRQVMTLEFADKDFVKKLQNKSREDFININIS